MSREKLLASLYDMISPEKYERFEHIAALRTNYITVVMENVYQDHNASAVMRTCDCYGIQNLHVIEKSVEYEIQREIARGAGRWIDLHQYNQGPKPTTSCIETLKNKGYKVVATSPRQDAVPLPELKLDQPIAMMFGTEGEGISDEALSLADECVTIPMYGFTESFNVSVSAALVLKDIRDRLEKSNIDFTLSENEQTELKIQWAASLLRNGEKVAAEIEKRLLGKLK